MSKYWEAKDSKRWEKQNSNTNNNNNKATQDFPKAKIEKNWRKKNKKKKTWIPKRKNITKRRIEKKLENIIIKDEQQVLF